MHGEFDIRFIYSALRRGWKTIAACILAGLIFAVYSLATSKPIYRVEMMVLPAPADTGNVANAEAGTGALGAIIGLSGGVGGSTDYVRYQRLMGSPAVAMRLQDKYQMLQYVYSERWDSQNHKWLPAPETLRSVALGWLFKLSHERMSPAPDVTTLADFIASHVEIIPSRTTDIVNVSMESSNVAFAKHVMLLAHEQTNALLRDQVARRARQQVAYLQNKLAQTSVADYRATLLALLSAQEKNLMLTQTDASFAAEIVSPPVAAPVPISPRPILSLVVAILVGGILGSLLVIFAGPDWLRRGLRFFQNRAVRTYVEPTA